jgi:type IV secretion system protein TrbL
MAISQTACLKRLQGKSNPMRAPALGVTVVAAVAVAIVFGLLAASPAAAAGMNTMMADVQSQFQGKLATVGNAMSAAAKGIFWSLATISFVWSMAQLALKAADIGEILTELIRFTVVTGIFWFILQNGAGMGMAIAQSFDQLAAAAGAGGVSTPDGVLASAGAIWHDSMGSLGLYSSARVGICTTKALANIADIGGNLGCQIDATVASLLMFVSFLATYLVLIIVAIDMLILRITLYLIIYLGLITLGFGGLRRTEDMAIGYLKTVGSTAIANMTMAIIAFLGLSFVNAQTKAMNDAVAATVAGMKQLTYVPLATVPIYACMEGLVAALVVLFLIKRVPHILGQMIGGVNAASQVSGAGAALVGAGVAGAGLLGGAMMAAGATAAADKASKGVEATMSGAASGGGDGPSGGGTSGGGAPDSGGTGPSTSGPLDGGGSTSAPRAASTGLSDFARKSGDTIAPARPVDIAAFSSGGQDGQTSGASGGTSSADAVPADTGGAGTSPAVGGAGQSAPAAKCAGGVQEGPDGGAGDTGPSSGLVAAGQALKVVAGVTGAALAVHDGVEPLSAARSAYRGGRLGRQATPKAEGRAALSGGVISGAGTVVDN